MSGPPVAGGEPGSGGFTDAGGGEAIGAELDGDALAKADPGAAGRTEIAEGDAHNGGSWPMVVIEGGEVEGGAHAPGVRAVGIDELGRAGFGFTDAGADLGESEFETFGLGGGRSIEIVLDVAGLDGIDAEGKGGDGGGGRMSFEIEL